MEITEVRVFLKDGQDRKLKAYATITFDNAFVVRNVKVIEGNKGLFVAMPSRKLKESCPKCGYKNVVRSKFCNQCAASLPQPKREVSASPGEDTLRQSEHKDIAHPITVECREYIQKKVLEAFEAEKMRKPSGAATGGERPSAGERPSGGERPPSGDRPYRRIEEDEDIEL